MSKLIPFGKRRSRLIPREFGNVFNIIDDFFTDDFPMSYDTFKVDIKEDDKNYYVEAELPGVSKDEIKVSVKDSVLKISVVREEKEEKEEKNYLHQERRYTSMERVMNIPSGDTANIKAKLAEGILVITVPKTQSVDDSKKIEIE